MKSLVLVKGGAATAIILVIWLCLLLVMNSSSPCVTAQRSGGSDSNKLVSSTSSSSTTSCLEPPPPSLSANPKSKAVRLGGIWSSGIPGKSIIVPDCSSSFSLQPSRRTLWWWQRIRENDNTTVRDSRSPSPFNWKQRIFDRLVAPGGKVEMMYSSPRVMKNMILAANVQQQISTTTSQLTQKGEGGLSRSQQLRQRREGNNELKKRTRTQRDDTSSSSKMKKLFELPSWFPTKFADLEEIEKKVKTMYWKKRHAISLQLKPDWKLQTWNQVPEGEVCEKAEPGSMVHEWRLVKQFDEGGEDEVGGCKKRLSTEVILLLNDYTVTTSAGGKGAFSSRYCPVFGDTFALPSIISLLPARPTTTSE